MSKPIVITHNQWDRLAECIKEDYPKSVYLIRDKMKRTLGFVSRMHFDSSEGTWVYLDFYDDKKKTMFLLKYSEYLQNANNI